MAEVERKIDLASETWAVIREHFAERIAEACDEVIASGKSITEYDVLRGKIAAYQEIFELAKPKAPPAFSEPYSDPSGVR